MTATTSPPPTSTCGNGMITIGTVNLARADRPHGAGRQHRWGEPQLPGNPERHDHHPAARGLDRDGDRPGPGGWYPVTCGGRAGWVSATYLQVTGLPRRHAHPAAIRPDRHGLQHRRGQPELPLHPERDDRRADPGRHQRPGPGRDQQRLVSGGLRRPERLGFRHLPPGRGRQHHDPAGRPDRHRGQHRRCQPALPRLAGWGDHHQPAGRVDRAGDRDPPRTAGCR